MKKIAIIGKGTAGALTAAHFNKWADGCEIDWYFDPSKPTQAVGEGSQICLPINLFQSMHFQHSDLEKINGTFKTGILKQNWSKKGSEFRHSFTPPSTAYHFNAVMLQDYIFEKISGDMTIHEQAVNDHDSIDADYIIDCSGRPDDYDAFKNAQGIPVNSVYVTQCYWDYPRFQETLTIARPYGWVFGIPLANRCSIGYMYNKNYCTFKDVLDDVQNIFEQYDLEPSEDTNSFSFENYLRKQNFTDRVAYNGNASFFLEPLEATSITAMDVINRSAFDIVINNADVGDKNAYYSSFMDDTQSMIAMHYLASDAFDSDFWAMARWKCEKYLQDSENNGAFRDYALQAADNILTVNERYTHSVGDMVGTWHYDSYIENIRELGIAAKLRSMYASC
jgi:hypothetical protein